MKETLKTSRVSGYLEKMYRQLNKDKFNNELEEPIITIMSTPKAYGHVTCSKVWKSGSDYCYELNIGAGTLDRPIESVVSTLLHEMVHIYNLMNNIQDCSRGNTYHNKKFKDKAESVGLLINHHDTYGWTITEPSDELILYIADMGWNDIMMNRTEYTRISIGTASGSNGIQVTGTPAAPTARKPSSTRKYICPKCKQSIRATKTVNIICGDCMEKMEVAP